MELLDPVKKWVSAKLSNLNNRFWNSNVGNALVNYQQSPIGQAHQAAGKNVADLLFVNPYQFGKQMAQDVPEAARLAYNSGKLARQGYGLPQVKLDPVKLQNVVKQGGRALQTGSFIAGAGQPLSVGLFSGMNYGLNRLVGQNNEQALASTLEAAPKAFQMAGISKFTNPVIDKIVGPAAVRLPLKSAANVVEGLIMDKATGYKTTKESIAIDALFPVASEVTSMAFKTAGDALRVTQAKILKSLGRRLRNNKGAYTTAEKYLKGTRAYFKSGDYAAGAALGFEPYQDEQGKWRIRFNQDKAILGIGLMFAGTKSLGKESLPEKGIVASPEKTTQRGGQKNTLTPQKEVSKLNSVLSSEQATKSQARGQAPQENKLNGPYAGSIPQNKFFSNINEGVGKEYKGTQDTKLPLTQAESKPEKIQMDSSQPTSRNTELSSKQEVSRELPLKQQQDFENLNRSSPGTIPQVSKNGKLKERGFAETLRTSPVSPQELKKGVTESADRFYSQIPNNISLEEASKVIETRGLDDAINFVKSSPLTRVSNAVGLEAVSKLVQDQQWNSAFEVADVLLKKGTESGQAIQLFSVWNRLTPAGIVKYLQSRVSKYNLANPTSKITIPDKDMQTLVEKVSKTFEMPEGREKELAIGEVWASVEDYFPKSALSKISLLQTMAQLLNPKTSIRNILGNLAFSLMEFEKDIVGAGLDTATSLLTRKKTKLLPSIPTQVGGFVKGLKEGTQEAVRGVNLRPEASTQFDLPKSRTFKDPILGNLEKLLNLTLAAPDRAFYMSAYKESLRQQMKINKVSSPAPEMIQQAHFEGLYRTFQDDSAAAKAFQGIKKSLNLGKEWGLGDLLLKYPKTPANLLSRSVDYSPAGFVKSVMELAKPLFGKGFDQNQFVDSFSRALVGTSNLIGLGLILGKLGVITGSNPDDADIKEARKLLGINQYQINITALKRLVTSGMNPDVTKRQQGDTLVSYDWAQPAAIGVSMGANLAQNKNNATNLVGNFLNAVSTGAETLEEQPLVSGLKYATYYKSLSEGFVRAGLEAPSSYVPTILSQLNQLMDNQQRETYDPNVAVQAINRAKAKIPGLAQQLTQRVSVLGTSLERYQDSSNNLFNVMLNPAFVNRVKSDKELEEVVRLYDIAGQTQQAPRVAPKKVTINGQNVALTPEQYVKYQEFIGKRTDMVFTVMMADPRYAQLPDDEKAKRLANMMTDINSTAKIALFGNNPKSVDKAVLNMLAGNYAFGIDKELNNALSYLSGAGASKKPSVGNVSLRTVSAKTSSTRSSSPKLKAFTPKAVKLSTAPKAPAAPKLNLESLRNPKL